MKQFSITIPCCYLSKIMIFFIQQIFFTYAWSAKISSMQPESSGIVVVMPFDGNVYFNNRRFLLEDNGDFPDEKKR